MPAPPNKPMGNDLGLLRRFAHDRQEISGAAHSACTLGKRGGETGSPAQRQGASTICEWRRRHHGVTESPQGQRVPRLLSAAGSPTGFSRGRVFFRSVAFALSDDKRLGIVYGYQASGEAGWSTAPSQRGPSRGRRALRRLDVPPGNDNQNVGSKGQFVGYRAGHGPALFLPCAALLSATRMSDTGKQASKTTKSPAETGPSLMGGNTPMG
jgi:hypothetical protein